ncbi:hypothetical protein COCC4DRAFT_58360 [Bipolaris maydis ATCC 48331]|uniref:Uncharacterized protein n=2 Tax=Cochliobolus heterostrophus TaxID=5016 RepID=M2V2J2_COCH5|nr:uncharacterized protein COCC4DRAFT_58360 [Bipolaris maydis ATCC 48331]EMD94238.1 hypothetical protein COCHEDRAFT_1153537 [Bipolaris maydis C5]ENI07464.1 hypothetical protein COCC4DRAFT_58360 [Bipolaris maydis ATCC 48331]KAJ6209682.1 hypothetical protein PSV09DRAFT_1153537 [Bipolaris maydis]
MIMTGALALHGSLTIFSFFFLPCDCHFLDLPIYLVFSFCFGSRKPPLSWRNFFCSLLCWDTLLMLHDELGT